MALTDDRLKIWLGFARFILGAFALGLVTTLINCEIQERDIELKEQDQVGQFLEHALQKDVGIRRRFAQYFSTVTRSHELRKRWEEYNKLVAVEYQETVKEKQEVQEKVKKTGIDAKERERLLARLAELEQALSTKPAYIRESDWFTVLASYREFELIQARTYAKKIAKQLADKGELYPIDIYKTRISRNYALTVGGRLTRTIALKLARMAREKTWADDAFAQVDRDWTFVEAVKHK